MPLKEVRKIMIWGKTYPELSDSHGETVCTGGCFQDGSPVRIYPVPFRYLSNFKKYKLYQWIEARVWPSKDDSRPESYKIDASRIAPGKVISPDPGWMQRREIIFRDTSWHYKSVEALLKAQKKSRVSLGIVPVGRIDEVYIRERPEQDRREHREKLRAKKQQVDLFNKATKLDLEFQDFRIRVKWRCGEPGNTEHCNGHDMAVLDWGLGELGRREGRSAALHKMKELANVTKYELRFYLGNIYRFPQSFTIVGVWYPKIVDVRRRSTPLFG